MAFKSLQVCAKRMRDTKFKLYAWCVALWRPKDSADNQTVGSGGSDGGGERRRGPIDDSLHRRFQRRRALIVGINYTSAPKDVRLRGCVNDAKNVHKFIHRLASDHLAEIQAAGGTDNNEVDASRFSCEIRVLTDDPVELALDLPRHPLIQTVVVGGQPTKAKLKKNLRWLVADADEHTSLWFSYSGHGICVRDYNRDERDFKDEALVPLDHDKSGFITDDWLRSNVVDALPAGAKLTCLVDACHSGTSFDLHVSLEDSSLYLNSANKRLSNVRTYKRDEWQMIQRRTVHRNNAECAADVLMISGCRDNQTSADSFEERAYTGAMTHAFLKHYYKCDDISQLLQDMSTWLRIKRYQQRPVLSFGSVAAERATEWHMQLF